MTITRAKLASPIENTIWVWVFDHPASCNAGVKTDQA